MYHHDCFIKDNEKWVPYNKVQCKSQWNDKNKSPQPNPKAEMHGRGAILCMW